MNNSATRERLRATFLLEVALDEARTRQRVADFLLKERVRRGHGDARRFPQPKMAELLGVSLRTYQHWEAADTMPTWRNFEEMEIRLEVAIAEIIGDDTISRAVQSAVTSPDGDAALEAVLERVEELRVEVRELRGLVESALEGQRPAQPGKRRARSAG